MVSKEVKNIFDSEILSQMMNDTLLGTGDSDRHVMTIFSIALASKGKKLLELGVRNGKTTLPLLYASWINNGKLISIDAKKSDFSMPNRLEECWEYIESDAIEYLMKVQNEKFDLIYIDDWHSYEHVKKELELVDKIIGPSGIVILHDLMYGNTEPFYHTDLSVKEGQWAKGGPYRAVAELDTNFWEWATIPWNNGLTILRKKYSSKYHNK